MVGGESATTRFILALALSITAPAACQDDLDVGKLSFVCAAQEHCHPDWVCDLRRCVCMRKPGLSDLSYEPVPGRDCEAELRWSEGDPVAGTDVGPAGDGKEE